MPRGSRLPIIHERRYGPHDFLDNRLGSFLAAWHLVMPLQIQGLAVMHRHWRAPVGPPSSGTQDAVGADDESGNDNRPRLMDQLSQHAIALVQAAITASGALGKEHHFVAAHEAQHAADAAQVVPAATNGEDAPGTQQEADDGVAEQLFLGRCPDPIRTVGSVDQNKG